MTSLPQSASETRTPASGARRGSYAKSAVTKAKILDAALAVFAESGYRSGSIRDIAGRVSMSEAGLLRHFRSKSELLAAVLKLRDERAESFIDPDATDGRVALQGLVEMSRHNATVPGVVELFVTLSAEATSPDHPAHQYFVDRYAAQRSSVELAFRALHESDQLAPGVEPAAAARTTLATMDGLQLQWLLDPTSVDLAGDLRAFLNRMLLAPL